MYVLTLFAKKNCVFKLFSKKKILFKEPFVYLISGVLLKKCVGIRHFKKILGSEEKKKKKGFQ